MSAGVNLLLHQYWTKVWVWISHVMLWIYIKACNGTFTLLSILLSRFQFMKKKLKQILPMDLLTVFNSGFLCSVFCTCPFCPCAWSQVRKSKGQLLGLMWWVLLRASHLGEQGLLAGAAMVAGVQGLQSQQGQAVLDILHALEKADRRVGWKVHLYLLWEEIYRENLTSKLCPTQLSKALLSSWSLWQSSYSVSYVWHVCVKLKTWGNWESLFLES